MVLEQILDVVVSVFVDRNVFERFGLLDLLK